MSYVALATDSFDAVARFYGRGLGCSVLEEWDRANGRGRRFDLHGLRLEILDNARERHPLSPAAQVDRLHLVIEVDDIETARSGLGIPAPPPQSVSWGATLFQIRDPDGVPVTFLEWNQPEE